MIYHSWGAEGGHIQESVAPHAVHNTHTRHHGLVLFGGGRGFFSSQGLLSWTPRAWAEKGRGLQDPGPSEQASSLMEAGWVHILGGAYRYRVSQVEGFKTQLCSLGVLETRCPR